MECPTPCPICGGIVELDDMLRVPATDYLVCENCFCTECDGYKSCGLCEGSGECFHCGADCPDCSGTGNCDACNGDGFRIKTEDN